MKDGFEVVMTVGLDRSMDVGLGEEGRLMEIMEEHGVVFRLDDGCEVGWTVLEKLQKHTRLGAYYLQQRRQYSSIIQKTSSLEITLLVVLRLHSLNHTPLMCHQGHTWTLSRDGRSSKKISLKVSR